MTTWMKHPELPDALIEVPDLAVIGHELSGWRITDPPVPAAPDDDTADTDTQPEETRADRPESNPQTETDHGEE